MHALAALLCIVTQLWTVEANVEKTIFLGPSPGLLDHVRPGLDDLLLPALSPANPILPAQLPVLFPSQRRPHGVDSWYLLRGLQRGQRYEVRICWPATQPTDFWLDTFPITQVFDTPHLISSLAHYTESRQVQTPPRPHAGFAALKEAESILFLRIQAAASYYSTNTTLMKSPLPVNVDIILDPFILNVFPRSLGPVALYISAVTIGAWFLSGYIYHWLILKARTPQSKPHAD